MRMRSSMVTVTPMRPSSSMVVVTSRRCGTLPMVTGPSASSAPARMGSVAFLAPEMRTSPSSAMPPVMCSLSTARCPRGSRRPLLRGIGLDRQRVYLAPHALAERPVHQLVAREWPQAFEGRTYQQRREMRVVLRLHVHACVGNRPADQICDLLCIHGGSDLKANAVARKAICAWRRRYHGAPDPHEYRPRMNAVEHNASGEGPALDSARPTFDIEAAALGALRARPDGAFAAPCRICLACRGRAIVTGMGKSGHIAHKIASTLASTGTPAFFLHPGEASHGDIGMITRGDALLALSNSGETPEVLALLPPVKRLAIPLIALTGNAASTLARTADVHLDVGVAQEACPHNLAPTASTTAALVMGDALAVALLEARGV